MSCSVNTAMNCRVPNKLEFLDEQGNYWLSEESTPRNELLKHSQIVYM
jgi:hypothetical protein